MQALWMLAASFLFACMGVCVKLAADQFSTAEIVFYRNIISLILISVLIAVRGIPLRTPHWKFQLRRGGSGFISLCLYFLGITLLPLATAVTLAYTSPLFLALYLAVFGKARLNAGIIVALGVGFAGVALLLRPSLETAQWLGILVSLASGMLAGVAYFNVRELGERGEPEERTVFYFSLLATLGSCLWLFFSGMRAIDQRGGMLLLGVGGFGTLAQLAMTRAYKRGKTLVAASLAYSAVIFASLFGMLIWKETLSLESWLAIGLIVASGVLANAFSKDRSPGNE